MTANARWLSRITPDSNLGFRELASLGSLDPYGQHQLLWRLFDIPRSQASNGPEFLFRTDMRDGLPLFYVVSESVPRDASRRWRIETKQYVPKLLSNDRLAFKLRANPVSLSKRERDAKEREAWVGNRERRGLRPKEVPRKRIRHDAVMDAKVQMRWKAIPPAQRPPLSQVAYDAGSCWLRKREQRIGCRIDWESLLVDGHRVHRMPRRRGIVISTLDFEGSLQVTDPEAFVSSLFLGVGPAKAFGCGLMLVRRLESV